MRRWIIWSFDRGSFQYDVLCGMILIATFAIPRAVFNDRPDFMRLPPENEIRRTVDDDGNVVYTVSIDRVPFGRASAATEAEARDRLSTFLQSEGPLEVFRVEPVHNTRDTLAAYAIWLTP